MWFVSFLFALRLINYKASENDENLGGLIGFKEGDKYVLATLSVYTKHQGKGIGSQLLDMFTQKVKDKSIKEIEVQVQTDNENALEFYYKHKFIKTKLIPKAYKRQRNPNAYLLSRKLN